MRRLLLFMLGGLILSGCGFHLRRRVIFPTWMQRIYLSVKGGGSLQHDLARALTFAGVNVENHPGPGIARLQVTMADFSTHALSINSLARVTEYAVQYQVSFNLTDSEGRVRIPSRQISMSREFGYNANHAVGNSTEGRQWQQNLSDDMAQAIVLRLQALSKQPVLSQPPPG